MKTAFAILMGLHGLIHLMGFAKAFGWGDLPMLTDEFSRSHGLAWLLAAFLFLLSLSLFLMGQPSWPWIAIAGVILSQVLVVISWADAKHGTWLNLIILLTGVVALAKNSFDKKVSSEVTLLFQEQKKGENEALDPPPAAKWPPVVERWIRRSGALEYREVKAVYLRQSGNMRTKPGGKWMPFTAEQWFSVKKPGFVWKTRVHMGGPLHLSGRDKFIGGKGTMDISLLSLFPVVRASGDPKIDQASGIRYLAEICWFPTAAREGFLTWEPMGEFTAKATFMTHPEITGIFTYDEDGNVVSFEALRYKDSGENAQMEKWRVRNTSHKNIGGLRIPQKSKVYWGTEEGEFHWLSLEIEEIRYN